MVPFLIVTDNPSDRPTLTLCLACGGQYQHVIEKEDGKYRTAVCSWCVQGSMSPAQVLAWNTRKSTPIGR
jgi:hypothetical protein